MKEIIWNEEKNTWLKQHRGVLFELALHVITQKGVLAKIEHLNQHKYPGQKIYVIELNGYTYMIPLVENATQMFFKTIIPSRKMKKRFSNVLCM